MIALLVTLAICAGDSGGEVAITIDDFDLTAREVLDGPAKDRRILEALRTASIKAELFVTARYLERPHAKERLRAWSDAGHPIGNHTYHHKSYNASTFEEFSADILAADAQLTPYKTFERRFRFPMLKEGNTAAKRDAMRRFLAEHGYRNGYVTIDTSDWFIDQRLRDRLAKDPKADIVRYRDFYLGHVANRVDYYADLARRTLGREPKHTLLIHHNLLNAYFLGDLIAMLRAKGWTLIDAGTAFADPLFNEAPDVLPAGESIIWSLAKASGRFEGELRYPGEDGDYEKTAMDALGL